MIVLSQDIILQNGLLLVDIPNYILY